MLSRLRGGALAAGLLLLGGFVPLVTQAADAKFVKGFEPDTPRITAKIDEKQLVTVPGSTQLRTIAAQDTGTLPSTQVISNMTLLLNRSADKQARFDAYVNQLNNPGSPYYHKWLSAKQIGSMFGPAQADIAKVTAWLASQGLGVDQVMPTGTMIRFSGSAAAVGRAFHTELHGFKANGQNHFANTTEQKVPAALAPLVRGVASLDNFFPQPQHRDVGTVAKDRHTGKWKQMARSPDYTVPPGDLTDQTIYDVVPADFNTIYNVNSVWQRSTPIRGAGQSVAVLERTEVLPADIETFRHAFLPADAKGTVQYINPLAFEGDTSCADPARNADEGEAALDAEWVGAAAPDATVVFASCDDSNSPSFGPFTAALNMLNADTPPPAVFSLSYGECEAFSVTDVTSSAGDIWEQAAAEGTTVFVSTGDAGSAVCDQNQAAASFGMSVNAMSSSPWNVAVGGTDFDDFNTEANYWTSTNLPLGLSAIGYIPEQTWNDSCASGKLGDLLKIANPVKACNKNPQYVTTAGASGGPSNLWLQPVWQTGIYGAPDTFSRMQPDISLFAANGFYGHSLVYCMSDAEAGGTSCDYSNPDNVLFNSAGGTSFAAPAMAGVQALINQAAGSSQGNIGPALYDIASKEYGTTTSPNTKRMRQCDSSAGAGIDATCVFNDVTAGDIDVPCYAGTQDCYSGANTGQFGVLSNGGRVSLAPAWETGKGYDYATGLGSVNVGNLVDAMVAHDQAYERGYAPPGDFLSSINTSEGDGYSDLALVNPNKGVFTDVGLKGSVVTKTDTNASTAGDEISAIGNFFPVTSGGLFNQGVRIATLAWSGPGNQLYVWLSDGTGGQTHYQPITVGTPYPDGWALVGAGDFDGVGQDELLLHNASTGEFKWWRLNLNVLFVLGKPKYHVGFIESPVQTATAGDVPTIADVNGDGYADIVWTNASNNNVNVWINNQAGSFVQHQIADHAAGFALFGAGDVNGDGKTDLIWMNTATSQMSWWVMNGFNVASKKVKAVTGGYTMASIADYDGDGLADILWVTDTRDVYEWQSSGSGFQAFQVGTPQGKALVVPKGSKVEAIRFQGSAATGGVAKAPAP